MNGVSSSSWEELESDPGLFTLLLRDFGIRAVAVEEVYDLHSTFDERAYGFVFLFKWLNGSRRRRCDSGFSATALPSAGGQPADGVFFARQVADNSCATYALLNILLNSEDVHLGPFLSELKEHTKDMNPTESGYAISNSAQLAAAHNSHARSAYSFQSVRGRRASEGEKLKSPATGRSSVSKMDSFHFSSFVCVKRRLFELDGLQEKPLDLGVVPTGLHWTEYFRRLIVARLFGSDSSLSLCSGEIRYNLMQVVPCSLYEGEQLLIAMRNKLELMWHVLEAEVVTAWPRRTRNSRNADLSASRSTLLKFLQSSAAPTPLRRCACSGRPCASTCSTSQKEEELLSDRLFSGSSICIPGIVSLIAFAEVEIKRLDDSLDEARRRRQQYEVDDQRRVHNYDKFIRTFLGCLMRNHVVDRRRQ